MGIDYNHARFLLSSWKSGVSFRKTCMLGRQFCSLGREEMTELLKEWGHIPTEEALEACNSWGEPFLRSLGGEEISSIDKSPFEGATLLQDMNDSIQETLRSRFDVVIDGGTLEHVFNFPVAIRNCMEMTAVGGHVLTISPANNMCGHGFYQFTPHLCFEVFSKQNGFQIEFAAFSGANMDPEWFSLSFPIDYQKSLDFCARGPTYLMVRARKLEEISLFSAWPQQAMYSHLWSQS